MSRLLQKSGSKITLAALLLALIAITVPAVPASAIPPAPHQFYGNVYVGGVAASSGTTIIARINGVQMGPSTTVDSQGRYGYSSPLFRVPADNPDTAEKDGGVTGDTIQFFVGGTQAYQSYVFQVGGNTNLDLTVAGTPTAPTVVTSAATDIAANSATLNGNLTATGSSTPVRVYFRYGLTTSYGSTTAPVSVSTTGVFAANATGLAPNTTYHFIAVAEGSSTVTGSDLTFTTLQASMTVTTNNATNVGSNFATLNATLTSLGGAGAVDAYFRYGIDGSTWPYSTSKLGMGTTGAFSATVSGLTCNQLYYFQPVVQFNGTTVYGTSGQFTTLACGSGQSVSRFYGYAYINGTPAASRTVVAYVNGSATSPASTTTTDSNGRFGYSPLFNVYGGSGTVTFYVNGVLVPQTATWSSGGVTQIDLYASPTVLTVTTGSGVWASATTATFSGSVTTMGEDTSATLWIDWGTSSGVYPNQVAATPSSTSTAVAFSITASPLTAGTTYYLKARAIGNVSGTTTGSEVTYTHTATPTELAITTTSLPSGTIGTAYSATISAQGGTTPYTWTQPSGTLPAGLIFTSSSTVATISGNPTTNGTSSFLVRVTDSAPSPDYDEKTLSITIGGSTPTPCGTDPLGCVAAPYTGRAGGNTAVFCRFLATSSTTVSKIKLAAYGADNAKVAIYSDVGMRPSARLAVNNTLTPIALGENTITLAAPLAITSGTYYWLACWTQTPSFYLSSDSGLWVYTDTGSTYDFPDTVTGTTIGAGARGQISAIP
ncbi:MAG: hypothetical protein PHO26_06805 [Dehalococcoidia bacterium]|nr:hypothetical protein [Dehalococcoidia bacterium]MDD5494376.1 hypothetical protein [Dehalococcoidia bacterium]